MPGKSVLATLMERAADIERQINALERTLRMMRANLQQIQSLELLLSEQNEKLTQINAQIAAIKKPGGGK